MSNIMDCSEIVKFLSLCKKLFSSKNSYGKISQFIWFANKNGLQMSNFEFYYIREFFKKVNDINNLLSKFEKEYTDIVYDYRIEQLNKKKEKQTK